jgi:DNA modification methylase
MVRQGPRAEELKDRVHPTQKPVGLFAAILEDFTDTAGTVLDPFLGSGTTMIAAERLGRRCYGMEIEPRYVDVAVRRWEEFTGRKAEVLHKTEAISA